MTIKKKAMLTSISIKIVIMRLYCNFFISVSSMEPSLKLNITSTKLKLDKSSDQPTQYLPLSSACRQLLDLSFWNNFHLNSQCRLKEQRGIQLITDRFTKHILILAIWNNCYNFSVLTHFITSTNHLEPEPARHSEVSVPLERGSTSSFPIRGNCEKPCNYFVFFNNCPLDCYSKFHYIRNYKIKQSFCG